MSGATGGLAEVLPPTGSVNSSEVEHAASTFRPSLSQPPAAQPAAVIPDPGPAEIAIGVLDQHSITNTRLLTLDCGRVFLPVKFFAPRSVLLRVPGVLFGVPT